jgi:hypothetical protein
LREESIFYFPDLPALAIQSDEKCSELYEDFFRVLQAPEAFHGLPDTMIQNLHESCTRLVWKADYASVIVFRRQNSQRTLVWVIGLDGWKSRVHTSWSDGRESISVPDLTLPTVFGLGPVETIDIDKFVENVDEALRESERHSGYSRAHRKGHLGNQKTPSFLRTIVWNSLQAIGSRGVDKPPTYERTIQGGTTDVGLHTGCLRRNTSFPLVATLLSWTLRTLGDADDQAFFKCLISYFASHLRKVGDQIVKNDPKLINRVIAIIRAIDEYNERARDEAFKTKVVSLVESYYEKLLKTRPNGDAALLEFPPVSDICSTLTSPRMPVIPTWEVTKKRKLEQARVDALSNLDVDIVALEDYTFNGKISNSFCRL